MKDRIDNILKDKLYDGEPVADFSGFDRIEESLLAAEQDEKRRRRGAFILLFGKYAAIVVVVLALSFLTYMMNRPSESSVVVSETVVETPAESDEGETDVPEISGPVSGESIGEIADVGIESGYVRETAPIVTAEALISDERIGDTEVNGYEGVGRLLFEPTAPGQIALSRFKPAGIIAADTALYDLDEYLAEFDKMYGEETDEDKSKWHPIIMADAFAINKTGDMDLSYGYLGISAYKYFGNFYEIGDEMTIKYDQILKAKYQEQIGILCSSKEYLKFTNFFPISFSLGVSRDLGPRTGIETGLQYSYLKSITGFIKWSSIYFEQKIQYLGVPINLSYSLLPDNSKWDIDLRGGVVAEKALSAIGNTTVYLNYIETESSVKDEVPSNIMLSGHAGMGFGYSLFKNIGIYLAPGFEYYFYTKGQPLSYKTDNPFRFNIKAGLKFDL